MGMMVRHNQKAKAALFKAAKPVPVKKEVVNEPKKEVYTKSDINTMNVAKLREVAKANGVEDVDDITGVELKKILIEKMGL